MVRPTLIIRAAEVKDVPGLIEVLERTRLLSNKPGVTPGEIESSIAQMALNPDERLLVGIVGDEVVGTVHMQRVPVGPFTDESVILTSFLIVHPDHRRHGYAHQLLGAAVTWAEEKDIHQIHAIANSSGREANRFYARLGMGTSATVRITQTTTLRSRLAAERAAHDSGVNRKIRATLAQRRSARRREQGAVGRVEL